MLLKERVLKARLSSEHCRTVAGPFGGLVQQKEVGLLEKNLNGAIRAPALLTLDVSPWMRMFIFLKLTMYFLI